jgi:hypothetical protein
VNVRVRAATLVVMLAGVVGGACARDVPVGVVFAFALALVYRLAVGTIEVEIEQTKAAAEASARRVLESVHRELVARPPLRGPRGLS